MKNQQGFVWAPLLIIIGAVVVGGFATYFLTQNSNSTKSDNTNLVNVNASCEPVACPGGGGGVPTPPACKWTCPSLKPENLNTNSVTNAPIGSPNIPPVTSLATLQNYNLQVSRLMGLIEILNQYDEEESKYPETINIVNDFLQGCLLNKPLSPFVSSDCQSAQESTFNYRLVLEDVYSGQPLQYRKSNNGYEVQYTLRFYVGMQKSLQEGLIDGGNILTQDPKSWPTLDTFSTDYNNKLAGSMCYLSANPDIVSKIPSNAFTDRFTKLVSENQSSADTCQRIEGYNTSDKTWEAWWINDEDSDGIPLILELA